MTCGTALFFEGFSPTYEPRRSCGVQRFEGPVAFALCRHGAEEGLSLFLRDEVEPDQGAADALAGLPVVEVTDVRAAADQLVQEVVQRTLALVEIQSQEHRVSEQIPA